MTRCLWAESKNPLMVHYHDTEWGVPTCDDHKLFEMLILEGAQAGLSWETILNKREGYRRVTHGFDPTYLCKHGLNLDKLMHDENIVRNRLKILSIEKNANAFCALAQEYGSFSHYLWAFVRYTPEQHVYKHHQEIPTVSEHAQTLSKDLKKHGCTFVGPTICYAYMQAVGMVNDHTTDCFRYKEIQKMGTTHMKQFVN